MILGIEGTGSQDWGNEDLNRTFVRRIMHQTRLRPASYFIGPSKSGDDGAEIMDKAEITLKNGAHNGPIILVGYSRGAAYCMEIARRFKNPIDVLVMFDAVARQSDVDLPEKVPANVKRCFHAIRDPRAGSRYFFQNVGLVCESRATHFEHAMFFGSHGAVGGTFYNAAEEESGNSIGNAVMTVDDRQLLNIPSQPVTNLQQDHKCTHDVATWMWPFLLRWGVLQGNPSPFAFAPDFKGSRVAGMRNVIH
jgi:pimeloyl-ACP methyl ester carboxylesterase